MFLEPTVGQIMDLLIEFKVSLLSLLHQLGANLVEFLAHHAGLNHRFGYTLLTVSELRRLNNSLNVNLFLDRLCLGEVLGLLLTIGGAELFDLTFGRRFVDDLFLGGARLKQRSRLRRRKSTLVGAHSTLGRSSASSSRLNSFL